MCRAGSARLGHHAVLWKRATAYPQSDVGIAGCTNTNYTSIAVLGYGKPNVSLGDYKKVVPVVVVTSQLEPSTGLAYTRVGAGLLLVDAAANKLAFADSLPQFHDSDPRFFIEDHGTGGESGPPDPGIIRTNSIGVSILGNGQEHPLNKWMKNFSAISCSCLLGAAGFIAGTSPAGIVGIGLIAPEAFTGITVGCVGGGVIGACILQ